MKVRQDGGGRSKGKGHVKKDGKVQLQANGWCGQYLYSCCLFTFNYLVQTLQQTEQTLESIQALFKRMFLII